MNGSTTRTRTLLVLFTTLGLLLALFAGPAAALTGDGDGDLEAVRAQTLGTIDYKIGLLTDLMNGAADNPVRQAVYADGIAQLGALRGEAVASTDIEALKQMEARAHEIYHATKAKAAATGQTEEEKIAEARKAALGTIDYKLKIFREAQASAKSDAHRSIYAWAIGELEKLRVAAETSNDIEQLYAYKAQAHEVYNAAKKKIAEAGEDGGKTEEGKAEPEKTEAEKAAEALASARRATLRLIEYKTAILSKAAEAAKNPTVKAAFAAATAEVAALADEAKKAGSVKELRSIDARVMEIYEAAKAGVVEKYAKPAWQPTETVLTHLNALGAAVERLVGLADETSDLSGDTAKAVAKAGEKVQNAAEKVRDVAESGKKLDDRWQDLKEAVLQFRKAFGAHVVAITGGPGCYNGWHIAA